MAGPAGILAGLVPSGEFQHPQRRGLGIRAADARAFGVRACGGSVVATKGGQRIQGQPAPRRLHGQEGHAVEPLARHGLEQWKQGAEGLADAGGRLDQQAAAGAGGLVDGLRQVALAGTKARVGKGELAERPVTPLAMPGLLRGPGQEAAALGREEGLQFGGARLAGQHGLAAGGDVQVDQRQRQRRQATLGTQQRAIDADLRPVQGALVVGHALQPATMGLDLLQPARRGVEAVGATSHRQALEDGGKRQLGLVSLAPPP